MNVKPTNVPTRTFPSFLATQTSVENVSHVCFTYVSKAKEFTRTSFYIGLLVQNFLPSAPCQTVSLAQGEIVRLQSGRPGFDPRFPHGDLSRSSCTSSLNIGSSVATRPSAWSFRVSAGTDWPSVHIQWLSETASWICNLYLSVAARTIV